MLDIIKYIIGQRAVTVLGSRVIQRPVIVLTYHDVRSDDDFASWLRVSLSEFTAQLAELERLGHFIHPGDLFRPEALRRHCLNFLLTFDDGYVNNYRLALPVLKQFSAPALFFVSTWHLETGEPFWFDRIVTPIQALGLAELDLQRFGLHHYRFNKRDETRRWDEIQVLLENIKALGNEDIPQVQRLLQYIDREYGSDISTHLERYRPIHRDELSRMVESGLCTVGSHAHRHVILTKLSDEVLTAELQKSKSILEKLQASPVFHLAYPNGDWDERVSAHASRIGFTYAFALGGRRVSQECNPLAIPRLLVGGHDSLRVLRFVVNRGLIAGLGRK